MGPDSSRDEKEGFHYSGASTAAEMETPTETSVFIPTETRNIYPVLSEPLPPEGIRQTSWFQSLTLGGDDNEDRRLKRCSQNLSLLVISEGIPLDPEKVVEAFVPQAEGEVVGASSRRGSKLEEEGVNLNNNYEGGAGTDVKELERRAGGCRNYAGIMLTLASGLVFTIGGVIVKYLEDYHPFTLAIFRFQGILLPSVVWVWYMTCVRNDNVFEPIWPPTEWAKGKKILGLVGRCGFGTTALFLHFFALKHLDVADALVIGACQPVFVTLAAYVFLGEACGVFPVFTALLTILGVGIISRPPFLTGAAAYDDDALIGAGFSVASMLTATMVFVIIRYLKDVHVSLLTLILGCWGTLQSIICSVIIGEFRLPESVEHWVLAVALAVITLLGQVGLTLALQWEQAGPVALIRTCDCLFAFVFQFIFLNAVPDLFSLTGALIIIFCVALTAFRKWVSTLPTAHGARRKFGFVMK